MMSPPRDCSFRPSQAFWRKSQRLLRHRLARGGEANARTLVASKAGRETKIQWSLLPIETPQLNYIDLQKKKG